MNYHDKVIHINMRDLDDIPPCKSTTLDKPKIHGGFSIDKDRNYVPGTQNMLYYYPRNEEIISRRLNLDLNLLIQKAVHKPEVHEKLDHLLRYCLENKQTFLQDEHRLMDADFVCYRGILTKIMCSSHLKDDWSICATKWKGSIYLCEVDKEKTYNISKEEMDKFCSWGYKFEQYMLTDKFGKPPDTTKPVYEAEEFCCIYKSKLGPHKLIYGAEMDGILSNKELNLSDPDWDNLEFIELKTNKNLLRPNDHRTIKMYKYIKWWCQSFLVNVKQVYCGFRDQNGIVREIVPYNVRDLPKISDHIWDWRACLNFCNVFLNYVRDIIPDDTDDPYTVWKFEWQARLNQFKYSELKGKSPETILPEWYIKGISKK